MPARLLRVTVAVVGILLLAVVILFGGAMAVLAFKPSVVTAQIKQQVLPRLSQSLGRPVDVSGVELGLLPPRATIKDVRVGGNPGEPPLVSVGEARASLRVWPLLVSRGREVSLRSIELVRPRINLVREPGGGWNFEGIPAGGGAGGASEGGKPGEKVSVSQLGIRDGELHVIDRSSPQAPESIALRHIDVSARGIGGSAARVELSAALAGEQKNLEAQVGQQRGAWSGKVSLDRLHVEELRGFLPSGLASAVTSGELSVDSSFQTRADAYQLQGKVEVPSLSLRGKPASAGFDFVASLPRTKEGSPTAEIRGLQLRGPGVDLGGNAKLQGKPTAISFALEGPVLDLDAVIGALPAAPAQPQAKNEAANANAASSEALPPSMRAQVGQVTAEGQLKVDRLVVKKLVASNAIADANLSGGVLTIKTASAGLYGGTLDASGSRVDLTQAQPRWELRGKLRGVNIKAAMEGVSGKAPMEGSFDGTLDLRGAGDQWAQLRTNMTGKGDFAVANAALDNLDLAQQIASPLASALKLGNRALGVGGSGVPQRTELHDLKGSFTIENGVLRFDKPITTQSPVGELSLGGTIGLDKKLDLKGTAQLSPQFISQATGHKSDKAMTVPLEIAGTLDAPKVRPDTSGLAKELLQQTPGNLLNKGLPGILGGSGAGGSGS